MNFLRPLLRRFTWLAFLSVLSMAVMPTLSHALAFAKGEVTTQICTPQGMKLVSIDQMPTGDGAEPSSQASMEHCPYCTLSSGAAPLPSPMLSWQPPALGSSVAPAAFFQAPRTLFAWASAQPRAPPVLA